MKSARDVVETVLAIAGAGFPPDRLAQLGDVMAADCVISQAPSLPFGGDWRGPEGFIDMLKALMAVVDDFSFQLELLIFDEPHHAVVKGVVSGRTARGMLSTPIVEIWTVEEGKVRDIFVALQDVSAFR